MEKMKVKPSRLAFVSLLFMALLVTACGESAQATVAPTRPVEGPTPTAPVPNEPDPDDVSLVAALQSADAPVERMGEVTQPFFAVTGQLLKVFDGEVQVFEYESETAAREQAALVSPDGSSVGTSMMSWVATPHFYHEGKWLVLYVGDDRAVIELLDTVLGRQFAGGISEAAAPELDGCPTATAGTRVLADEAHGYCLLYPAEYSVERPNPDEAVLVIGSLLNVEQPRAYIAVQDAVGRSAAQAADELTAGFEPGQFDIARTDTTIAGVDAVLLDHVPGQDINRLVVLVRGERLYTLTFAPADESLGDVFARLEALYATVVDSFRLLPQSTAGSEAQPTPTQSPQWITYHDRRNGYGLALPCQWVILPSPMEGNYATLTLRSYDDAYYMENTAKGMWQEGEWPEGAMKIDMVVIEGLPSDQPLAEAARGVLGDSEFSTLESVDEFVVGAHQAVSAVTASRNDPLEKHTTVFFRMAPDQVLLVSVAPEQAWGSSDIQGILNSLTFSPEAEVAVPSYPPSAPIIAVPESCTSG
jgi:hypothetical protein